MTKISKRRLIKFIQRRPEKYDFRFITEERGFLPVPRSLITALGNPEAALFLIRLIELQNFWVGIKKRGRKFKKKDGWFYTTNENLMAALSLKNTRFRNAKKLLKEKKLIDTKQHDKQYYWIDRKAVKELIRQTVPAGEYGYRKIRYNNYR
jgi:hypothetical protein